MVDVEGRMIVDSMVEGRSRIGNRSAMVDAEARMIVDSLVEGRSRNGNSLTMVEVEGRMDGLCGENCSEQCFPKDFWLLVWFFCSQPRSDQKIVAGFLYGFSAPSPDLTIK